MKFWMLWGFDAIVSLVLALPALLFVLFFGALLITNPRWN